MLLHHGVMGMIEPKAVFNRAEEWHDPWTWAAIHALFIAGAGLAAVIAWRLNENIRERMRAAQAMLADAAMIDSLTELSNRRQLMADLERLTDGGPSQPTLLAMFDLDGFKVYNDTFGHQAGDTLLARLALLPLELFSVPTNTTFVVQLPAIPGLKTIRIVGQCLFVGCMGLVWHIHI